LFNDGIHILGYLLLRCPGRLFDLFTIAAIEDMMRFLSSLLATETRTKLTEVLFFFSSQFLSSLDHSFFLSSVFLLQTKQHDSKVDPNVISLAKAKDRSLFNDAIIHILFNFDIWLRKVRRSLSFACLYICLLLTFPVFRRSCSSLLFFGFEGC
jgi:hypothetical protein